MTPDQERQLEQWVAGNPIHMEECCPDFSCCRGTDKMAPLVERERFAQACREGDENTKMSMPGGFLTGALSDHFADKALEEMLTKLKVRPS